MGWCFGWSASGLNSRTAVFFRVYINYLIVDLRNDVKLFADDTAVSDPIKISNKGNRLQSHIGMKSRDERILPYVLGRVSCRTCSCNHINLLRQQPR